MFYEGVYVPGNVEFLGNGKFISKAGVLSDSDVSVARKAAFARFMLSAKNKGYRFFEISAEKTRDGLGKVFNLTGIAYKSRRSGSNVYPIDAVKRLLRGLPLEEPKPVYKPKPRKKTKVASKRTVAKKKIRKTRTVPKPVPKPTPQATEEPLVIMAPEDITGSVKRTGRQTAPTQKLYSTGTGAGFETNSTLPDSVSGLPQGVVLRRR